jgi:hypothetical protein
MPMPVLIGRDSRRANLSADRILCDIIPAGEDIAYALKRNEKKSKNVRSDGVEK